MGVSTAPLLIAGFGNSLAGDDAFGPLVIDLLQAMSLPEVELAAIGMQPFGLVHRLNERRQGLVIVDASQATAEFPPGKLLNVDFFAREDLQLVHDLVLSTHGLSVANELELARKLGVLPPRVRLVAATVESVKIGAPATTTIRRLVRPAAECVARLVLAWQVFRESRRHA